MSLRILLCITMLCLGAAACGMSAPVIPPRAFAGTRDRVEVHPGNGEAWRLDLVGGHRLTGTGTWLGEACCAGPLTVSGYGAGDSLRVDVAKSNMPTGTGVFRYQFDGAIEHGTLLVGPGDSPSMPNEFRRRGR